MKPTPRVGDMEEILLRNRLSCPAVNERGARLCIRAFILVFCLAAMAVPQTLYGEAAPLIPEQVESGLSYLLAFGDSSHASRGFDMDAAGPVVAFIRQAAEMARYVPRERVKTRGSFAAYSVERPLQEVVRYAYNAQIPGGAINPSSIHYSEWKAVAGGGEELPDVWRLLDALSAPEVIRGVMRETISPDLHTGTYYEYDLQRTIVLYRQATTRVVISLSAQIGHSQVGRKGVIVGDDQDWNYLYTQDQGLNRAGLGWVKSRIYQFFSVCIYIEDDTRPGSVKVGVFQWLGAGWAGFNMVDSHHIRNGVERYAVQFKGMLESEQMPDPATLERVSTVLGQTDERILRKKAYDVTQHIQARARQEGSVRDRQTIDGLNLQAYVDGLSKAQLVTTLMREFVKFSLGKETPLKASFWVAVINGGIRKKPLS